MFILFDIGRTKFRFSLTPRNQNLVSEPEIIATPTTADEGLQKILSVIKEAGSEVEGVAIGASGKVWGGANIKQLLGAEFSFPIHVCNDATLAALGEAVVGAGKGRTSVAYLTVSSGVGGAIIRGGRLDQEGTNFEPGEQVISMENGAMQTLEELISGLAFETKYGRKPFEINDPELWAKTAKFLAIGLHNSIVHWLPEVFILGGSMFRQPGIDLAMVKREFDLIPSILPKRPQILSATLGETSGLEGGRTLLLSSLSR